MKGDFGFFKIHSIAKLQNIEGGPLGENLSRKKVSTTKKTERGNPLVSPGIVCYAEKEEHFRFSSLGQPVQFGTFL